MKHLKGNSMFVSHTIPTCLECQAPFIKYKGKLIDPRNFCYKCKNLLTLAFALEKLEDIEK